MKTKKLTDSFSSRLQKGLDLSFKRLVKAKQQTNASLAFSKDGKIIRKKAKDIIV